MKRVLIFCEQTVNSGQREEKNLDKGAGIRIIRIEEAMRMDKFIPYEKLSKKKQRELDAMRRSVWTISPVTRKPANPKAYNRKKAQKWRDDSGFCAFDFL